MALPFESQWRLGNEKGAMNAPSMDPGFVYFAAKQ